MMDIGEQYGLSDLRHLISQPFTAHRNQLATPHHQPHYGLFLVGAATAGKVEEVALSPPPNYPIHESPPPPSLPPPGPPPAPLQHQKVGLDFFPGFAEESDGGYRPTAAATATGTVGVGVGGSGTTAGGTGGVGGCSLQSLGRWPRQETLTLLEIRSRLDSKFKEAAQKAPLWDEVSRIMAEEHGYLRSGKKCREKLENLYKYYKKTKEGKAGRHDGKHYRFFRQLEALYGENSNSAAPATAPDMNNIAVVEYPAASFQIMLAEQSNQLETLQALKHYENLSFSSSSTFDGSSSEGDDDDDDGHKDEAEAGDQTRHGGAGRVIIKRERASLKAKMREFVDLQLKRFMAVQEGWLERMLATLEHREQERMFREEEWRKQEAARFEQEHKFWAKERAWIEARDAALIEALEKLGGGARAGWKSTPTPEDVTSMDGAGEEDVSDNRNNDDSEAALEGTANYSRPRWPEAEVTCLIQLRTGMEGRFQEGGGCPKKALWEEISTGMRALGYDRSGKRCKEKWENINKYFRRTKKCHKKRKENSRTCPYYKHLDYLYCGTRWSQLAGRRETASSLSLSPTFLPLFT